MGAEFWGHEAPWQPDAGLALRQFQIDYFQANYNFLEKFQFLHESALEAVRLEQEGGDEFGLLKDYSRHLQIIEDFAREPLPTEPLEQISVLRRVIESISPDGFRDILDVKGIASEDGDRIMRLLSPADVAGLIGNGQPTRQLVTNSLSRLIANMTRGDSIAPAVHDEDGHPTSWFFAGFTSD